MKLFDTVCGEGSAEQIIEKSRFIAYVAPAESREEADAFIAGIRKKHRDATHNVPAMVIGDQFQLQWGSDDGEPQGTSGAPIVQMLVNEGITNTVIVVTRYFGGIKLGTGGLVRAYTSSAKLGLKAAGVCTVEEMVLRDYQADYAAYNRIINHDFVQKIEIGNLRFTDCVEFDIVSKSVDAAAVHEQLNGLTNGKIRLINERNVRYRLRKE